MLVINILVIPSICDYQLVLQKGNIMRDLNTKEILMIDGGAGRGDSGSDRMERNSSSNKDQGEIWGGSLACGLFGAAVGAITKSGTLGLAAGTICSGVAGNLDHSDKGSRNHNGGAYRGHGGGMDGSSTGFGR